MSTRAWPSIGLLFLDDLHSFGRWISDRAPEWLRARGHSGPPLPATVAPPPVLVVVARSLAWVQLELSAAWMGEAEVVVIVLDRTGDVPYDGDPDELREFEREELQQLLATRFELIEVADADGLERAIEQALARARELAEEQVGTWRTWDQLDTPGHPPSVPGPWLSWSVPHGTHSPIELVDVIRALAPALCVPDGRPSLLDGVTGERIDLREGTREPLRTLGAHGETHHAASLGLFAEGVVAETCSTPGTAAFRLLALDENPGAGRRAGFHHGLLAGAATWLRPIAATPDGRSFLSCAGGKPPIWTVRGLATSGGWGQAIGIDPTGRVAWTGGRCFFDWRVLGPRGAVRWTPSNHDWPCGHAKKLYGYEDNDPLLVQLAADASACLSIYEHDTLLTPGLPLRWRDLGGFALAERARGEPRALLFTRADGDDGFPGDPYEADEDARDSFVVASIGPSPRARYMVGLGGPTYRLVDGVVTRLGSGDEWLVCDEQHRIVRREPGRMLAGWGPWVVFEREGAVWREHVEAGTREHLGAVDRPIAGAVAVAGTANVVLISLAPALALRLV